MNKNNNDVKMVEINDGMVRITFSDEEYDFARYNGKIRNIGKTSYRRYTDRARFKKAVAIAHSRLDRHPVSPVIKRKKQVRQSSLF